LILPYDNLESPETLLVDIRIEIRHVEMIDLLICHLSQLMQLDHDVLHYQKCELFLESICQNRSCFDAELMKAI